MDAFLQKDIEQLGNEREELFLMLERFEAVLGQFARKYNDLCMRKNHDLKMRKDNAEKAMHMLAQKQQNELQQLYQARDNLIRKLNTMISDADRRYQSEKQVHETQYKNWEQNERSAIDVQTQRENEQEISDTKLLDEISAIRGRVRTKLKNYSAIVDSVKKPQNIDQILAEEIISRYSKENRTKKENQIFDIHNSLLKRIFMSSKRNKFCCELEEMYVNIQEAVQIRRTERRSRLQKRMTAFEQLKRGKRVEIERENEKSRINYENISRNCTQEIQKWKADYTKLENDLKVKQQKEYQDRKSQLDQDNTQAEKNWNQDKTNEQKQFVVAMETVFPVKNMYDSLRKCWEQWNEFGPRSFGTRMIQQKSAVQNVLVGEVYIDVARWYANESGAIIKTLLVRNYPFLFGRRNQNGKDELIPESIRLPYKLSLDKGESFVLRCQDSLQEQMESFLHAISMRLLWAIPFGQSQFMLGDSNKVGSFAEFSGLDPAMENAKGTTAYKSILDGNRLWDSDNEICQRICDNRIRYNDMSRQMRTVSTLREYNNTHPMNKLSYLFTILKKFPFHYKEESIQSLRMMSTDCGKMGYSSFISGSDTNFSSVDSKLEPALKQLLQASVQLYMVDKNSFQVLNSLFRFEKGSRVIFYPVPDKTKVIPEMEKMLKQAADDASKNLIYFEQAAEISPLPKDRFTEKADKGIVVPIGYLDGGEPCRIIFDDSRVHTIVNGDTGSGKTNLLHVVITNILLRYAPEEVQMYLIDFKHGTEFKKYTSYNLPNFRAISVCNEPLFALEVLKAVEKEQKRRVGLFGNTITNINHYNKTAGKKEPRIVLVLDELYELFLNAKTSKDLIAVRGEIMRMISEFAIQSRAYGIHMLIAGQNLTEIPDIRTIKESCNTRIALRCGEGQAEIIIGKEAKERMRLINKHDLGACVIQLEKNGTPFVEHTAFLDPDTQHIQLLQEIHKHYMEKKQFASPRILTTNICTDPNNIFLRYLNINDLSGVKEDTIWIGEQISMDDRNGLPLRGKNIWIVGGNTREAYKAGKSTIFFTLLSLLIQKKKNPGISICFFNGEAAGGNMIGIEDRAGEIGIMLKNSVEYCTGTQIGILLQNLYQELSNRKSQGIQGNFTKIYFILSKPEEILNPNIDSQYFQMLQEILVYGPECGIQTIIWTRNIQKISFVDLPSMPFGEKILLEMESSGYQTALCGSKPVYETKGWNACTSSNYIMRIYDLPEKDWVEKIIKKMKS